MAYKDPKKQEESRRRYRQTPKHHARRRAYDSARHANVRAARYGCEGTLTTDEVADLFARSGCCHYCRSTTLLGLDHVAPLYGGGLNLISNVVVACHSCNSSKCRRDRPWGWSRNHDACVTCGGTDRKHICHGQCARCHRRERSRRERASKRQRTQELLTQEDR